MAEASSGTSVNEAVGVFDEAAAMEAAMDELLSSGFDRSEISLLAAEAAIRDKLGHLYEKVEDVEDDPRSPRAVYVSAAARGDAQGALVGGLMYVGALAAAGAVLTTGGTLGVAIGAAAAAGGAALAGVMERRHADYLSRQIERGGLVLWVRVGDDEERRQRAVAILSGHSAHDVHVLALPVA